MQLPPLFKSVINKEKDREELTQISKSPFLGKLCTAFGKDLFSFAPSMAKPQAIADSIAQKIPAARGAIQTDIAKLLETFLQSDNASYQNLTAIAQESIEVIFLNIFIAISKANPPTTDKDVLVVLTENLVNFVKDNFDTLRKESIEDTAPSFVDKLLRVILGANPQDAFAELSEPLQAIAIATLKKHVTAEIISFHSHLRTLEDSNEQVADAKKSLRKIAGSATVDIMLKDVGDKVVNSALHKLNEVAGVKLTQISTSMGISAKRSCEAKY